MVFHCKLICIPLIRRETEHLFINIRTTCISFNENSFAYFFFWFVGLFLISLYIVIYTLYIITYNFFLYKRISLLPEIIFFGLVWFFDCTYDGFHIVNKISFVFKFINFLWFLFCIKLKRFPSCWDYKRNSPMVSSSTFMVFIFYI